MHSHARNRQIHISSSDPLHERLTPVGWSVLSLCPKNNTSHQLHRGRNHSRPCWFRYETTVCCLSWLVNENHCQHLQTMMSTMQRGEILWPTGMVSCGSGTTESQETHQPVCHKTMWTNVLFWTRSDRFVMTEHVWETDAPASRKSPSPHLEKLSAGHLKHKTHTGSMDNLDQIRYLTRITFKCGSGTLEKLQVENSVVQKHSSLF